jgi:hypothetical protein
MCDCSDEIADVDASARSEEPEIVEVPRLVPSAILKSYDLFSGDFVEAIRRDWTIFQYVIELCVARRTGSWSTGKNRSSEIVMSPTNRANTSRVLKHACASLA